MKMEYFSDTENGKPVQNVTEVPDKFWLAILSAIKTKFNTSTYGNEKFENFKNALHGEVPDAPLNFLNSSDVPDRSVVMDIIQFSYKHIDPNISFGVTSTDYSAKLFRIDINRLFERNALAFKLLENGNIERLVNPVLSESLKRPPFNTGDTETDSFLNRAVSKFLHHDLSTRKEALEALWDAFERIKTLEEGHKKASVKIVIDKSTACEKMRDQINKEATALTEIGNKFMIRHSEKDKIAINEEKHVDYLFHRMFALLWLWLESTGRINNGNAIAKHLFR
jgi:hypothetical protein